MICWDYEQYFLREKKMQDYLNLLSHALVTADEDKILRDAFRIIIKRYFQDNPDAEDMDPEFRSALEMIFELSFGGYDNFDEFIERS
jgi:hypothetical protein